MKQSADNTDKLTSVILCLKLSTEHSTTSDSRINLNYQGHEMYRPVCGLYDRL